ncbi:MAG: hypothetical protein JST23_06135 [Bacteroidetes bacterium]|nr:hypothetical protein [Bacteroidota bacterium]
MKRVIALSVILSVVGLVIAGCTKYGSGTYDEQNYWLSKERGRVVYSSNSCNYFVVETNYGYTIIRSYGYYKPYERSIVYGDFSRNGNRDFYNYSTGIVFSGTVTDYWLNYVQAQTILDYYCPFGKGARAFAIDNSESN